MHGCWATLFRCFWRCCYDIINHLLLSTSKCLYCDLNLYSPIPWTAFSISCSWSLISSNILFVNCTHVELWWSAWDFAALFILSFLFVVYMVGGHPKPAAWRTDEIIELFITVASFLKNQLWNSGGLFGWMDNSNSSHLDFKIIVQILLKFRNAHCIN